jgi:hypothetical protein
MLFIGVSFYGDADARLTEFLQFCCEGFALLDVEVTGGGGARGYRVCEQFGVGDGELAFGAYFRELVVVHGVLLLLLFEIADSLTDLPFGYIE